MILKNETDGTVLRRQDEPLVSLTGVSPKIKIYPSYYLQKMPGTSQDLFLREEVARKIVQTAEQLPDGLFLVLIDGWRSFETQRFIYERTIRQFRAAGYSENRIQKEITDFVACPSKDPVRPAPHYSGGAIDLTLADDHDWIDMGTGFDDFTERAHLDFFEGKTGLSDLERLARDHRRFLRDRMEGAGFTHYPTEWWHYSYGDRAWAREHQTIPLYGGIERT
ncbi:hypothetical protein EWI07_03050 [Sporolactobacillus sp. THM7-4]|nr:hypothetical protein EWI07_03050 [Sporolactobacillus sp. THM7-4]